MNDPNDWANFLGFLALMGILISVIGMILTRIERHKWDKDE
jgi:hypothetical protein